MSIDKIPEYTIFKAGADDTPAIRIPIRTKEIPINRMAGLARRIRNNEPFIQLMTVNEFEVAPLPDGSINVSRIMQLIENLLIKAFGMKYPVEEFEMLLGYRGNCVFSITLLEKEFNWSWSCEYPVGCPDASYVLEFDSFGYNKPATVE